MEMIQTQMSFVFLTGKYTYKTKKPVNLGYLDYTTLEKRLHFCRQELELNRRLAPDAYLDVLPIAQSREGIKIGGNGETLEYAVKMKQLPQDRMMDVLLKKDGVTSEMLGR
ncbi:MAG: AAA family ATPase, partial [Dehalococcoidia bacterium]